MQNPHSMPGLDTDRSIGFMLVEASAINDLHYDRCLKFLSKSLEPSGGCNLKEFSNISSSVNP